MPTYDNYAYERVQNAYDKTYDKIMRTTKSRNVRQYSYACRTRTQEARTTTVRTGPKNVVRVYNCRTSVMCFVRLSYACRTTPTIPYDMRTDSVQNTYSRRTKCVRHEKSSAHLSQGQLFVPQPSWGHYNIPYFAVVTGPSFLLGP